MFAASCHHQLGVIHWYRANTALAFGGGQCTGGGGVPEPTSRLFLGDSASALGLSVLVCVEGLRLGDLREPLQLRDLGFLLFW